MPLDTPRRVDQNARNRRLLDKAREEHKSGAYSSPEYRASINEAFRKHINPRSDLHTWQKDVAEAVHLGLDCIAIAGTGKGKTIPFFLDRLLDTTPEEKKSLTIIISPLIELQREMASAERATKAGLSAVMVNSLTWNDDLKKDLLSHRFQVILIGPEMFLLHDGFRGVARTPHFMATIRLYVVDEAHCVEEWGKEFRPVYEKLDRLRAFCPSGIPFLAVSATLTPITLKIVRQKLGFDPAHTVIINLGNDRGNITEIVHCMDHFGDMRSLDFLVEEAHRGDDLIRTIVYVPTRDEAADICEHLRSLIRPERQQRYHRQIDYIHARRDSLSREKIMWLFADSEVNILIATEAAGMGTNLPRVRRVVQYGTVESLVQWNQHKGRAGRDNLPALSILVVQPTLYQLVKPKSESEAKPAAQKPKRKTKRRKKLKNMYVEDSPDEDDTSEEDSDASDADQSDPQAKYRKKVKPCLRRYLDATDCRRAVSNRVFNSPPETLTVPCCDLCLRRKIENAPANLTEDERELIRLLRRIGMDLPTLPDEGEDSDTEAKPDIAKPPRARPGFGPRKQNRLRFALETLREWRKECLCELRKGGAVLTIHSLLPDDWLISLAKKGSVRTIEDIREVLPDWFWIEDYGAEVLQRLMKSDEKAAEQRPAELRLAEEQRKRDAASTERVQIIDLEAAAPARPQNDTQLPAPQAAPGDGAPPARSNLLPAALPVTATANAPAWRAHHQPYYGYGVPLPMPFAYAPPVSATGSSETRDPHAAASGMVMPAPASPQYRPYPYIAPTPVPYYYPPPVPAHPNAFPTAPGFPPFQYRMPHYPYYPAPKRENA